MNTIGKGYGTVHHVAGVRLIAGLTILRQDSKSVQQMQCTITTMKKALPIMISNTIPDLGLNCTSNISL